MSVDTINKSSTIPITKDNHYVNNADFLKAIIERKKIIMNLKEGEEVPQLSNYLAKCIFDICNHLSYKWKFIGYSYRQEMVSDALEMCVKGFDNFDAEHYSNPHAFFTQFAYYAFFRRIAVESKQSYIKAKIIEKMPLNEMIQMEDADGEVIAAIEDMRQQCYFDTAGYEAKKAEKAAEKAKKAKNKPATEVLESFMTDHVE